MADLSDVEAKLAELIAAAIYPDGPLNPSTIGAPARIYPGWPVAKNLDSDLLAGIVNVSVFPMHMTPPSVVQVNSDPIVLVPPVHGLTIDVTGRDITVTGTPSAGEFVSILLRDSAYSRAGATADDILAALQTDIAADYAGGATLNGSTLTIGEPDDIIVRVGAPGTMVQSIRRILQPFTISIWAPSPDLRHTVGALVNQTLINAYRVEMADKSHMRCVYYRTDESDLRQNANLFRRDLVFNVDYGVTEQFEAVEITSVITTFQPTNIEGGHDGPATIKGS